MVQHAKSKGDAPTQLRVARWCTYYHTPPRSGGIYEQDYREMVMIDALPGIHDAVTAWRTRAAKLSENERKTIEWLVKIGAM